jgi:hypothetical protein
LSAIAGKTKQAATGARPADELRKYAEIASVSRRCGVRLQAAFKLLAHHEKMKMRRRYGRYYTAFYAARNAIGSVYK